MRTLILVTLLFSTYSAAAAPPLLSHQGRLLGAQNEPLQGPRSVVFTIWDDPAAGTALWSETVMLEFDNGYYDAILGATSPIEAAVLDASAVWLAMTISGEELLPRQRIVSAPFALRAGVAEAVAGGAVDASTVSVGGIPVIDGTGAWVGPPPRDTLGGLSCAAGTVPMWDGVGWGCVPGASLGTTLTEAQVDAFVANNGYLTAPAADAAYVNEGQAASVSSAMLADNSVTSAKIAPESIVAADIATGAVGSTEILDGGVGNADLADSAVTSAKIAFGTITRADIYGDELPLFRTPNGCGGSPSSLTLTFSNCPSIACGICLVGGVGRTVYYSCDGSCPGSGNVCGTIQNLSPLSCAPLLVGYLLGSSIP